MEKHNEGTITGIMHSYKADNPTYLDKIKVLVNWKPIEKILKKKYKWTKNAVGNSAYSP